MKSNFAELISIEKNNDSNKQEARRRRCKNSMLHNLATFPKSKVHNFPIFMRRDGSNDGCFCGGGRQTYYMYIERGMRKEEEERKEEGSGEKFNSGLQISGRRRRKH